MATSQATPGAAAPQKRGLPFPLRPAEGWTTVVFAAVLVLITVGCIQSLNWTAGSDILTSTTLVGMTLGFILAKQNRVPQWLADMPALVLGVLFAFWQTARADEGGSVQVLWHHLGAWLRAAQSGAASSDDAIFLLFLSVLTMLLGYVSMWLIFRSRSPWLAAAANAVVLLINLNYAADDKTIYAIIFLLAALLLIVRFNLVERMRIWKRKGLRFPSELNWDFMQAGVIFTIIVIVVAAALPSSLVSGQLQNLWNGPNSPWQGLQNTFGRLFHVDGGKAKASDVAFGNNLTIQGSVNLPDIPILNYTTTDTSGSYLTAVTFDHFNGITWTQDTTTQESFAEPPNQNITPETPAVKQVTAQIHILTAPGGSYIYGLAEPASFSVQTTVHSDGRPITGSDQIGSYTDWEPSVPLKNGQIYSETSFVSTATATDLDKVPSPSEMSNAYPPALLAAYTQLPNDLPNGNLVQSTALQWTAPYTSMYAKLNAIVEHFGSGAFQYSTDNPDIPSGTDAALYFLQHPTGYCTWFSTTMVMMARELGYPAREVEGFITGTYDLAKKDYIVNGTSAHAWVQVYFPGYGWINFEPSRGFSSGAFQRPTKNPPGTGDTPPPVPGRKPIKTTGGSTTSTQAPVIAPSVGNGGAGNVVVGAITVSLSLVIALLLLAVLSVALWWRLLFRRLSPISRAFARMTVLGRMAGVPPRPAQTASEYGAALAAQVPDQRGEIEAVTELYVRERWDAEPPDAADTLAARWQQLRARLVRQITRRRLRRR
jgi:transglutaminase-like putative cysteine protease